MKTKNLKSVLIAIIALVPVLSEAQVQFYLKQGMVVSTLSNIGNLGDNTNSKLTFTVGGFASIPLNNTVSFQPEVNYVRKGRSESMDISGVSAKTSLASDYIQIPLLVRFTPKDLLGDVKSKFFFTTGLYESILLNSEQIVKAGNAISGNNVTSDYKKSDFGLVFGGGVQFPFRQKTLQVELRYDLGLTKVSDSYSNYNTKALSLTLGMVL
jgi:hypothetical protein